MYRYDAELFLGSRGTYCGVAYNFAFLFATRRSYMGKKRSHSGKKYNFMLLPK